MNSKTIFSKIGRALFYLGVFFIRRNPSADTPARYAWDVYARLWHPLLWVYLLVKWVYVLVYTVYQILAYLISSTIDLIKHHGWMKIAYTPKQQDKPNQTNTKQQ